MASEIISMGEKTIDILPKIKRYAALDALRGIAALLLVVFHVKGIPQLETSGEFKIIVGFFGAGVPLFYALSAFSLMVGYHDKLQTPEGLLHFYIRRIFRILPLFYTLLVFWLFVRKFYFGAETKFSLMALNYLCAFGLIPGQHEGLVWASWSIGVEMLFYIMFPLALIASRTLLSSSVVFFATLVISVSGQMALTALKDVAPTFSYMSISTQIVFFGAGCFAYRLGEFTAKMISEFSQIARQICADVIFMSGIVFLLLYWLTPLAVWAAKLHLGTAVLAVAWILMLSPVFINGKIKTLTIASLEQAGKMSFSLYLLNPPLIFFMSQTGLFKKIYANLSFPNAAFAICLLITLSVLWICSKITYNLVEENGIHLGNHFLEKLKVLDSNTTPRQSPAFFPTNIKLVFFCALLPWLIWGGLELVPKSNNQVKTALGQSVKPKADELLTKKLWESLSPQDALMEDGNFKLLVNGIRIHPSGNPKSATFLVAGKFKNVKLICFINELPASALLDPKAANANVEIFVDGKSQARRLVDSKLNQTYYLDLTTVKEIKVVVDNANGSANWDWVNIGLEKL